MARQPSGKGSAQESGAPLDDVELDDTELEDAQLDDPDLDDPDLGDADLGDADDEGVAEPGETVRSIATDKFWSRVRVQPVEIALPSGVGFTLRAYRLSSELTPTEVQLEDDDFDAIRSTQGYGLPGDDDEDERELSAAELAAFEQSFEDDSDEDEEDDDSDGVDAAAGDEEPEDGHTGRDAADIDEDDEEVDEDGKKPKAEEVPAFLSHRGRLLLFRSGDGLVEFVTSDAEHDLTQLDTWDRVRERVQAVDIAPAAEDRYELDLVVENLRGGPDVWDVDLLIQAGELARDAGFALRIKSVVAALSSGSPLDDLDEALRGAANGGIGGFFARRRLRKIGAQQAAIGWRTIIGKISAAVDWRD